VLGLGAFAQTGGHSAITFTAISEVWRAVLGNVTQIERFCYHSELAVSPSEVDSLVRE
ncbi:hypothetical protein JRQ81_007688, partial [Phrynocephalus forsythii]